MAAAISGCSRTARDDNSLAAESRSPSAQMEIVEALRRDQEAIRHPADGGGEVRFQDKPMTAIVSHPGRWTFVYVAGPMGIAEDGWLYFQAPPFWGWSTPQVLSPEGLGYTTVRTTGEGLTLSPITVDQQLLGIQVQGRDLVVGEEIVVDYGAGSRGALADRFAESRSCFYFAVDGDGDGIRSLVQDPLCVEVQGDSAASLALTLPSTTGPGGWARLSLAVLDAGGNRVSNWSGSVQLTGSGGLEVPERVEFQKHQAGTRSLDISVPISGTFQVMGSATGGIEGTSNPMVVDSSWSRILWADLHGHSGLSDGTGTPKDYFRYARDVAALDVVALTDHDHWGMQPLAVHPELWEEIRRETELFHRPGEFITLLGYEWTSWIHGHRHVLYFSDQGRVLSSVDPEFESPLQLWAALRGTDTLTFAHHSAGGPVATNWEIPPDPELEPVTEIVSVHGSSESLDSPASIYSPVPGNFVRDVLDRGFHLGFIGSGDGHDGHPGLAHLNAVSGGLAAILSPELSREGVLEALRSRRVYATNGARILLKANLDGHAMGSTIDARSINDSPTGTAKLEVTAIGTGTLQQIDLIRPGNTIDSVLCEGSECSISAAVSPVKAGEYLYLRVLQTDGGAAWSSPFFFR